MSTVFDTSAGLLLIGAADWGLVAWLGIALLTGWLASFKGRTPWIYGVAALLLGPIPLVAVLLMPRPARVREAEAAAQASGKLPPRWKRFIGTDD